MYKIIVWGCRTIYNAHLARLRLMEASGEVDVLGVYAANLQYGETIDNYPILTRSDISCLVHDYLLIMADKLSNEILQEYLTLGGKREKAILYRVLDIPNMSFSQYIRIREARFSILSESCYGGLLYNYLCLEALSPLKNMWLYTEDYFRLLDDLPYYMSLSPIYLHPYNGPLGPYAQPGYPILLLGDSIRLHCNHDSDPYAAIEKWNMRCKKINYQNLLVTFFAKNPEQEAKFYQTRCSGRRLCFTPYQSEMSNSVFIPAEGGDFYFTGQHRTAKSYNTLLDTYSLFYGPVKYRRT